jgi:hypothetical protein
MGGNRVDTCGAKRHQAEGLRRGMGFYYIHPDCSKTNDAGVARQLKYSYEIIGVNRFAYVGLDEKRREFTPEQLADHALQEYLNVAEKHPMRY